MTQEDKELLLKDLCARQPYGVKIDYQGFSYCLKYIEFPFKGKIQISGVTVLLEEIKPYLRPMSSMTEEELKEFVGFTSLSMHRFICSATNTDHWYNTYEEEDWLNSHHFDYRRLIQKGLALEAPEGMYN